MAKAIETNSGFIVNENGELLIVVDKDGAGPGEITRRDATKLQLAMLFGAQPTESNGLYTLTKNGLTVTYDPSSNLLNYSVGNISVSPEVASLILAGVFQVVDEGGSKYIVYGNTKIPLTQTNVERLTRAIQENRGFVVKDGTVYVVVSGKAGEGEISEEELKTVQVPTGVRLVDKDRLTIDDLAKGPVKVLIQTKDGRWVPGVARLDGDDIKVEPLAYNAYLTLYRDTINKLGNVTSIRFVDERGNVVTRPSEQDLMWGNLKLQVNVGGKWYDVVVREDGTFVVKDVEVKIPTIKNGKVVWETIRGDMTLDALNQILEYLNTATSKEKLFEIARQKIQLPTSQNIFGGILGQSFIDLARDELAKKIVEDKNNLFNLIPQLVIQRVGDVIAAAHPVEVQTKSTIVNLPTLDAHGNVVVYKQLDKYDQATTSVNVVTRSYIENGKPVIELSLRSPLDPNRVYTVVKREVSPGASQEDINNLIQDMYREALLNYYKDRANFVYDQNRKEIKLETPNLNAIEKTIDLLISGDTKNINIVTVNVPTLEELRMKQQLEDMHPVLRNIFAASYAAGATLNKPILDFINFVTGIAAEHSPVFRNEFRDTHEFFKNLSRDTDVRFRAVESVAPHATAVGVGIGIFPHVALSVGAGTSALSLASKFPLTNVGKVLAYTGAAGELAAASLMSLGVVDIAAAVARGETNIKDRLDKWMEYAYIPGLAGVTTLALPGLVRGITVAGRTLSIVKPEFRELMNLPKNVLTGNIDPKIVLNAAKLNDVSELERGIKALDEVADAFYRRLIGDKNAHIDPKTLEEANKFIANIAQRHIELTGQPPKSVKSGLLLDAGEKKAAGFYLRYDLPTELHPNMNPQLALDVISTYVDVFKRNIFAEALRKDILEMIKRDKANAKAWARALQEVADSIERIDMRHLSELLVKSGVDPAVVDKVLPNLDYLRKVNAAMFRNLVSDIISMNREEFLRDVLKTAYETGKVAVGTERRVGIKLPDALTSEERDLVMRMYMTDRRRVLDYMQHGVDIEKLAKSLGITYDEALFLITTRDFVARYRQWLQSGKPIVEGDKLTKIFKKISDKGITNLDEVVATAKDPLLEKVRALGGIVKEVETVPRPVPVDEDPLVRVAAARLSHEFGDVIKEAEPLVIKTAPEPIVVSETVRNTVRNTLRKINDIYKEIDEEVKNLYEKIKEIRQSKHESPFYKHPLADQLVKSEIREMSIEELKKVDEVVEKLHKKYGVDKDLIRFEIYTSLMWLERGDDVATKGVRTLEAEDYVSALKKFTELIDTTKDKFSKLIAYIAEKFGKKIDDVVDMYNSAGGSGAAATQGQQSSAVRRAMEAIEEMEREAKIRRLPEYSGKEFVKIGKEIINELKSKYGNRLKDLSVDEFEKVVRDIADRYRITRKDAEFWVDQARALARFEEFMSDAAKRRDMVMRLRDVAGRDIAGRDDFLMALRRLVSSGKLTERELDEYIKFVASATNMTPEEVRAAIGLTVRKSEKTADIGRLAVQQTRSSVDNILSPLGTRNIPTVRGRAYEYAVNDERLVQLGVPRRVYAEKLPEGTGLRGYIIYSPYELRERFFVLFDSPLGVVLHSYKVVGTQKVLERVGVLTNEYVYVANVNVPLERLSFNQIGVLEQSILTQMMQSVKQNQLLVQTLQTSTNVKDLNIVKLPDSVQNIYTTIIPPGQTTTEAPQTTDVGIPPPTQPQGTPPPPQQTVEVPVPNVPTPTISKIPTPTIPTPPGGVPPGGVPPGGGLLLPPGLLRWLAGPGRYVVATTAHVELLRL
ncbi:MAG: hypothetical protein QXS16_01235 [Pyrobaculum sp.]